MTVAETPGGTPKRGRSWLGQGSLRRYAMDRAVEVARDPGIDPDLKDSLITQLSDTAAGQSVYGRLVYRLIAVALGSVAILVVVFSFILFLNGKHIDAAFYTLGSAAIGALGGVFAPHANDATPTTPGRPAPGGAGNDKPGGAGAT